MSVKVYGVQYSTCTRRVTMCLLEKGVEYELVNTDIMVGAHKQPEFLAKQPFGIIPVFEDGDIRIIESRAIARYICNKWASQGTDLLGKDAKAKAATDSWLEIESCQYNPPVSSLVFERVFKAMFKAGPPDEAVVEANLKKIATVLDIYEAILSKQAYLAGAEFSLADLSHMPYTQWMIDGKMEPFAKHPAVQAWWDKIAARPTWVKLVGGG